MGKTRASFPRTTCTSCFPDARTMRVCLSMLASCDSSKHSDRIFTILILTYLQLVVLFCSTLYSNNGLYKSNTDKTFWLHIEQYIFLEWKPTCPAQTSYWSFKRFPLWISLKNLSVMSVCAARLIACNGLSGGLISFPNLPNSAMEFIIDTENDRWCKNV